MDWWLIAFLNSFVLAGYIAMNAHFKMAGNALVFGRSAIIVIAMLPFMLLIEWPSHLLFYIFTIASGVASAVADIIVFNCIARYGSGAVSRLLPLKIWIVFVLWMIVSPSTFLELWSEPWRFFTVVSVLILAGVFLMSLNRCPISHKVLLIVLIPTIMWSFSDVMFKGAMIYHDVGGLTASFQFVFVLSVVMTLIAAVNLYQKGESFMQDRNYFYVISLAAVVCFTLVALKALAFIETPNPGYVLAISSLNVVWIYIYHRLKNIPDNSNVMAGLFFVLSTVGLVLLTK